MKKFFFNTCAAGAIVLGFAATASAGDCMSNCPPTTTTPTTQRTLTLDVQAGVAGHVGSQFMGMQGSNDVYKFGETSVDTETTLGGFCTDGPCIDTSVKASLAAFEEGGAQTMAGTQESGQVAGLMNAGTLQASTALNLGYDGTNTMVQGSGAAAFANDAAALVTGQHVNTDIASYGYGLTKSTTGIDGTACATCSAFLGGVHSAAAAGTSLLSQAQGGQSGHVVAIENNALTAATTQAGTMFDQTSQ